MVVIMKRKRKIVIPSIRGGLRALVVEGARRYKCVQVQMPSNTLGLHYYLPAFN